MAPPAGKGGIDVTPRQDLVRGFPKMMSTSQPKSKIEPIFVDDVSWT
jgi:hypothetical protein